MGTRPTLIIVLRDFTYQVEFNLSAMLGPLKRLAMQSLIRDAPLSFDFYHNNLGSSLQRYVPSNAV